MEAVAVFRATDTVEIIYLFSLVLDRMACALIRDLIRQGVASKTEI